MDPDFVVIIILCAGVLCCEIQSGLTRFSLIHKIFKTFQLF